MMMILNPKAASKLQGIFPEYHAGTDTLQQRYYPRNAVTRWKRQKYMYMVSSYFHRVNLKLICYRNLMKYTLYSLPYVSSQKSTSDTSVPIQHVISCHIQHDVLLSVPCSIYIIWTPASGRITFPPRLKTGCSIFDFHKLASIKLSRAIVLLSIFSSFQ